MTAALSEEIVVTLRVARALEKIGVRYLVGGSFASSFHGDPRSSNDVDIVAELGEEHVEPLAADLAVDFYVSVDAAREAVRRSASFNVIHNDTMFKVDIFVMSSEPFACEEMNRRQRHGVGGGESAFVASAEDIILHKLRWYRLGREISERQWADVLGVIRVQGDRLDLAYLRTWAPRVGVADLCERALDEVTASRGPSRT